MEKYQPTEFDKKINKRNFGWFGKLLQEGGLWKYEVTDKAKYVFTLKDGSELEIFHFVMEMEKGECELNEFLLAEIDKEIVGYLYLGIETPTWEGARASAVSDIHVLIKGRGIGGKLEMVKQMLLQRRANEIGAIENKIFDENRMLIEDEQKRILRRHKRDGDEEQCKKEIGELLVKRQNWLVIYGNGGKGGYTHEVKKHFWGEKKLIYKRYDQGEKEPELSCTIKENRTDLKKKASRFVE